MPCFESPWIFPKSLGHAQNCNLFFKPKPDCPTCAVLKPEACCKSLLSLKLNLFVLCPVQDAPEMIEKVLTGEQDLSTKRNAFQFLCNHAQERAVTYLLSQVDNVALWGDILQMAVLELIRKVRAC